MILQLQNGTVYSAPQNEGSTMSLIASGDGSPARKTTEESNGNPSPPCKPSAGVAINQLRLASSFTHKRSATSILCHLITVSG